jgi:hypothetical protein
VENKDFDQIAIIRDLMLEDPNIEGLLVWQAAKLALEDKYLYELMIDWAKETHDDNKKEMLREVVNYTDEILRKAKITK